MTVGAGLGPAVRALARAAPGGHARRRRRPCRCVAGARRHRRDRCSPPAVAPHPRRRRRLGRPRPAPGSARCSPSSAWSCSGRSSPASPVGASARRCAGCAVSPGALARENAMRSPRRTAGTASALMVGVAVVTLFTVFAASLKSSINGAVQRSFAGDLAVTTGTFGGALSPQLATDLAALPEVRAAAGLGRGVARIAGQDESVTVADPVALSQVLDLDVTAGALGDLGTDGLAVSSGAASAHHWSVGSAVPVTFTDGTTTDLRVAAIYHEDDLPGPYVLPRAAWAPHAVQDLDATVYVALAGGVGLRRRDRRRRARRRPVRQPRGARPRRLRRRGDEPDQRRARVGLRDAGPGRRHRPPRHRQHAVAVHPRTDQGARRAARRSAPPGPGSGRWCAGSR